MEKSSFFKSIAGDRKYKVEDFAAFFNSLITNGVFPNPSSNLQVIANNNMTVTIKAGKAWINGYCYINDSDLILPITVADGVLKRIDRIVIQFNTINRNITAKVKKGTFASTPVAPVLQRDADVYELGIADIYVANGAVSISQANITDLRLDTTKCGIVNSLIQADTTAIFNQYQAWFTAQSIAYNTDMLAKETDFTNQFNTWFATVQGQLSGDIAGNLTNQINSLAGSGRTTQTVKGNADAIAATNTNVANLSTSVATSLAEMGTQVATKAINTDNARNTTAKDVTGAINELFLNANNLKTDWAGVIGSPLVATDTSAQLKSKTQTLKDTMATSLTAKGQSSVGTEGLSALVNKINSISTSPKTLTYKPYISYIDENYVYTNIGKVISKYDYNGTLITSYDLYSTLPSTEAVIGVGLYNGQMCYITNDSNISMSAITVKYLGSNIKAFTISLPLSIQGNVYNSVSLYKDKIMFYGLRTSTTYYDIAVMTVTGTLLITYSAVFTTSNRPAQGSLSVIKTVNNTFRLICNNPASWLSYYEYVDNVIYGVANWASLYSMPIII
jgi:hypothetical protein